MSFVDEDTEVLFNFLIDLFGLPISLRVVCGREVGFYSGHCVEISHELCCELGTSVTDGFSRKTELGPDMITINVCSAKGREFHIGQEGNDVLRESVDNGNDSIIALQLREWSDKIDRYVFPWSVRDCVWM